MKCVINIDNITNLYPVDVMLNHMIHDRALKGCVLYPYIFMLDVTVSDNVGHRV